MKERYSVGARLRDGCLVLFTSLFFWWAVLNKFMGIDPEGLISFIWHAGLIGPGTWMICLLLTGKESVFDLLLHALLAPFAPLMYLAGKLGSTDQD